MATLMTYTTAAGKKDRCDAKCYNAEHEKCVCCCSGRNHGAGFVKAVKNTIEHFEEMVKDAEKIQDPKIRAMNIKRNEKFFRHYKELKKQLSLFGQENEDQLLSRLKNIKIRR